jgi:hypothetical protein
MTAGLQRLQLACNSRRDADYQLESSSCQLAWSLASMVNQARLGNIRLPHNYVARVHCGEPYLAKCAPICSETQQVVQATGHDDVLFLLARRDSMFARMEPRARELSHAQILEFMHDIENGLIEEIADFVNACNRSDERAALCLHHALSFCVTVASDTPPTHNPTKIFYRKKPISKIRVFLFLRARCLAARPAHVAPCRLPSLCL